MIKDIDGKREFLKMGVRVVDHWYVHFRDPNLQLEMILMDQKVSTSNSVLSFFLSNLFILICCYFEPFFCRGTRYIALYRLVEGETYIIHNFKILKNEGQYRICEYPFKLLFIVATSVSPNLLPKFR